MRRRPMLRASLPATLVALLCAAVALAPAASGSGEGGTAATVAAKAKKCKKKKKAAQSAGKRKRCKHRKQGSGDGTGTGTGGGATTPARLLVTEKEYTLQLSRPSVAAGQVIVDQYNHGEDPHDLRFFKTSDATLYSFDELGPGLTARKTLSLSAGTWQLYCSLLDHQSQGMQAYLTVN